MNKQHNIIILILLLMTIKIIAQINQIQIYRTNYNQTEIAIALNPSNPSNLMVMCNGNYVSNSEDTISQRIIPCFITKDGGKTWEEKTPFSINASFDPVAFFDIYGNAYYLALGGNLKELFITKSTNSGNEWRDAININKDNNKVDKPHAMADLSGIFPNNIYVCYAYYNSDGLTTDIKFSKSSNSGVSFNTSITIYHQSNQNSDFCSAPRMEVGPNGEVYIVTLNFPSNKHLPSNGLRFYKSIDGGETFTGGEIIRNIRGIGTAGRDKPIPAFNNTRAQSFPDIDVDRTSGIYNGMIYIVYADRYYGNSDIWLLRSTDGGVSWLGSIKVNDNSIGNEKQQWLPSVSVDQTDGKVYVSYYNMDNNYTNEPYNYLTSHYIAVSDNGGESFECYKVSESNFLPRTVSNSGVAPGYMGDYYEVVSYNGVIYPTWSEPDNNGIYQAYYSNFGLIVTEKLTNETEAGKIGKWDGRNFVKYGVPINIDLALNQNTTLLADKNVIDNQKFYIWENETNMEKYINYNVFFIANWDIPLIGRFKESDTTIEIKNNLENTEIDAANDIIMFTDPWMYDFYDENYQTELRNRGSNAIPVEVSSPLNINSYSNFQGVFLAQGWPVWDPPYYSVKAVSPQTIRINGTDHTFYFQNWEASPSGSATFQNANALETPVVFNNAGATVKAVMKGTQLSNYSAAYSNNNQKKIAAIRGGEYISVYESMGKIWIEKLKLDGTWELMENGDLASDIYECKNPSIAVDGNNLFIVFQENVSSTSFNIRLMAFDVAGNSAVTLDNEIVETQSNISYDNANPVISVVDNYQNIKILLVWKEDGNAFYSPGLYYSNFSFENQNNQFSPINYGNHLQGTDINSYNPSLTALKDQTGNLIYHLTWQQNISSSSQSIKYTTISDNSGTLSVGTIETPSSGSGYTKNYNPSITVMDNNVVRLGWVGYKVILNMKKTASENILGTPYYQAVMREKTSSGWSSVFYKRGGSNVSTVNINRSTDNNSVLSWVQGTTCKYILNKSSSISTLNESGNYIQLSNGTTTSEMRAVTFLTSTPPYPFTVSSLISVPKTNNNTYSAGREGIISKDGAEFYFVIGDVTLDGNNVEFLPITAEVDSSNYFSYLESESMSVNDNSSLTYSVLYGFVDSMKVAGLLNKNKEVTFKVELIDANSGELLGVYDNVTYNSGNLYQYDNIAYSLNMNGIGSREVKLRLRIEENIDGKYTLADITAEEELLPKTSVKELSYQGELAVKEYALEQNYPNPFNPSTTIKYQLPKNGNVKLVIYDMLGREIKTLVNGFKRKGRYEVEFDASKLSSGVYIYRIKANEFSASRKMMLIK